MCFASETRKKCKFVLCVSVVTARKENGESDTREDKVPEWEMQCREI